MKGRKACLLSVSHGGRWEGEVHKRVCKCQRAFSERQQMRVWKRRSDDHPRTRGHLGPLSASGGRDPTRPSPGQVCLAHSWRWRTQGTMGDGKEENVDLADQTWSRHLGLCPVWAWAGGSPVLGAPRSEHLQILLFSSAPEGGQPNRAPMYKRGEQCCCSFLFSSTNFSFKISRKSHGGKSSPGTHLQGQRGQGT